MKKHSKIIMFLLAIICLSCAITVSTPVYAQVAVNTNETTVCVFGEAKLEVKPDTAHVNVKIENVGNSGDAVKKQTFENYNNVVQSLVTAGLNKNNIKLTNFYTNSNCFRFGQVFESAVLNFKVTLNNTENLNKLITLIEQNENAQICNITFEVTSQNESYQKVLNSAVENAKQKAQNLLNKTDLTIVKIMEENTYCCGTLYKDYVDTQFADTLVENVTINAKVRVEFN